MTTSGRRRAPSPTPAGDTRRRRTEAYVDGSSRRRSPDYYATAQSSRRRSVGTGTAAAAGGAAGLAVGGTAGYIAGSSQNGGTPVQHSPGSDSRRRTGSGYDYNSPGGGVAECDAGYNMKCSDESDECWCEKQAGGSLAGFIVLMILVCCCCIIAGGFVAFKQMS